MRWFRGGGSVVVVVGLVGALVGVPPASAGGPYIGVSAPLYESPGGTVPVIVTVYGVPRVYRARIAARGTNGAGASCLGGVWHNRRRATASRKCYLHLPLERGSYNVRGRGRLVKDGAPDVTVSGVGSRAVQAEGYKSYTRMSAERIRRVERCFNDTRRVWLTFDDGGSPTQVRSILATLRRNGVRGRFLFTGAWAAENPGVMRDIRQGGHLVANHTYSHPPLSKTSDAGVRSQIRRGVQELPSRSCCARHTRLGP